MRLRRILAAAALVTAASAHAQPASPRGHTPLHEAAWKGCVECVENLLAAGANVRAQTGKGATPLHFATAAVQAKLIAAGADPAARDDLGRAPLHTSPERTEALLTIGINAVDAAGFTALHVAALKAEFEGVKWLLEQGADPAIRSTAVFEFSDLGPAWGAAPSRIEAGARALDIAKWKFDQTKWSIGGYRKVYELLDSATPRTGLFRR